MEDDAPGPSPFPEHPDLRDIAEAMEAAGMLFEIVDARFRCVYFSKEWAGSWRRLTMRRADRSDSRRSCGYSEKTQR